MGITLLAGAEVEVDGPPLPAVTATVPADLIASVTPPSRSALTLEAPATAPVIVDAPGDSSVLVVPVIGPKGEDGNSAGHYEYEMPVAQTTVLVDHPLGYDPVAVQVLVDGQVCSEYSVVYTIPNAQVRLGFDVSVQALIRLM